MNSSAERRPKRFTGVNLLLVSASLVIVIAGLKAAGALLVPFLFAVFLAILGTGPLAWMKSKGVPSGLAVFVITICIVGILTSIIIFLGNSLNAFSDQLPLYRERVGELLMRFFEALQSRGIPIDPKEALGGRDPGQALDMLGKTARGVVSTFSQTLAVIFIMIFMLLEAAEFKTKIQLALGDRENMKGVLEVGRDVQRYLAIKTVTSALTGFVVGFWTYWMEIDFPILWGITAFIANYVPFIGSTVAAIPAILLSLIQYGPGDAATVIIGYFCINVGISNFIEPVLMGRRLGLSVLIVFLSLIFWGWIWGPAGALMSVPLTMMVKILLEHSHDFRWVAVLMGVRPKRVKKETS